MYMSGAWRENGGYVKGQRCVQGDTEFACKVCARVQKRCNKCKVGEWNIH